MRLRLLVMSALVALLAAAVVPSAQAQLRERVLVAPMSGSEETPDDGDSDGYGAAVVDFSRRGRICFRIEAREIEDATAGHIHRGAAREAGPIVVPFFEGRVPSRRRCVRVARALRAEIRRYPARFYVNVHNEDFPGGAIRGQLGRY
jgi:hypothetical protein